MHLSYFRRHRYRLERSNTSFIWFSGLLDRIYLFSYEDLKKIFGRYGRIVDITLPLDYYTRDAKGKSKWFLRGERISFLGYGFVEYEESRDAGKWKLFFGHKERNFFVEEALHALDRYRLLGRELEVEFARGDRKSKFFEFCFKNNESYF
jgi:FUS-interacting serine-arginine-rich protein 1